MNLKYLLDLSCHQKGIMAQKKLIRWYDLREGQQIFQVSPDGFIHPYTVMGLSVAELFTVDLKSDLNNSRKTVEGETLPVEWMSDYPLKNSGYARVN